MKSRYWLFILLLLLVFGHQLKTNSSYNQPGSAGEKAALSKSAKDSLVAEANRLIDLVENDTTGLKSKEKVAIYQRAAALLEQAEAWEKKIDIEIKASLLENDHDGLLSINRAIDEAAKRLPRLNLTMALAYHKRGVIYNSLNDYEGAAKNYKIALGIRDTVPDNNKRNIALSGYNLGKAYFNQEMPDSALFFLEKAQDLFRDFDSEITDPKLKANVYQYMALSHAKKGDLSMAKELLQFTVNYYTIAQDNAPWLQAPVFNEMGILLRDMEEYEASLYYFNLAEDRVLSIPGKTSEDWSSLANIYNNRAYLFRKMGLLHKSILDYEASLQLNEQFRKDNPQFIVENLNNLGISHNVLGDFQKAVAVLKQAIEINQNNLNNPVLLAKNFDNLGDAFNGQGEYPNALDAYQQAISLYTNDFLETSWTRNPKIKDQQIFNKQLLLIPLASKARNLFLLFKEDSLQTEWLKASFETYQIVDSLIDEIRREFQLVDSKESLSKQVKTIYEGAIEVCQAYQQLEPDRWQLKDQAYCYFQKSKSLSLLENIRNANALESIADAELLREEERLRTHVAYWQKKLRPSKAPLDAHDQLLDAQRELSLFVKNLEKSNTEYYRLKHQLELKGTKEISEDLTDREVLAEYFLGEKTLFAFVFYKQKSFMVSVPLESAMSLQVENLRKSILDRFFSHNSAKESDQLFAEVSYQLYQQLIKPLELDTSIEKLTIIPDDVLGYIPFDALLEGTISSDSLGQYKCYPYLFRKVRIAYKYSGAFPDLEATRKKAKYQNQVLAFAPVQDQRVSILLPFDTAVHVLDPLKFSSEEMEYIKKSYSGLFLQGEKVQKSVLMDKAPQYGIIHFSGHGLVNETNPNFSCLVLSLATQMKEENLLSLKDIQSLQLNADLVVLSACQTSEGQIRQGEGIYSLARGFSQAGARSIISTLWTVNQKKNVPLIQRFYDYLGQKKYKDEALCLAKRNFFADQEAMYDDLEYHPYFWAGLVAIGNMDPVSIKPKLPFGGKAFVGGVVILLLFLFLFLQRKRQGTT